jgi:transcriptional regulator with XRE-family HTH domain
MIRTQIDTAYIAKQLKIARQLFGLTQENVAEMTGLSTRTIEKVESGRHRPDEQTLRSLCRGLGLDATIAFSSAIDMDVPLPRLASNSEKISATS